MSIERYSIAGILATRAGAKSFHVASTPHMRVEFFQAKQGKTLGPVSVAGDVMITSYGGTFRVECNSGEDFELEALNQAIIPEGIEWSVSCLSDQGGLQVVWAPPFPRIERSR
jgi:hypothetical protein